MANLKGTNVLAPVLPFSDTDEYATHEAKYGKGGWREVATIQDRDAITEDRREAGMAVYVVSENKTYILNQDLTTWTELVDTSAIEQEIEAIQALIPAQASEDNQLADKNFVNSSVATNTAYFIGTFNSVEELEAYSGTLTNNDYAFVVSTDAAGNTVYDRYKYNADTQQWIFEYELNNSSFTADQWAAINSGATSAAIAQINTNTDTISEHIADTNNPHEVTKAQVGLGNVDNTSDLNKPISTATQTALNAKQDALVSGTNIKTINNESLLGAGNFSLSEQLAVLPEPTSADDARIVQYVGETIRTKHEFIRGERGERTGTLSGYANDTSTLKTKLASINSELGMDCDRLKFVVVSRSSGYYYDVYACEGVTETLYQQNTNNTSAYGIRIETVGSSDIGTYIYFDMIYDDEYNYSGNFYKCFKRVVVGENPSAMYVAITNLDLVNSKIAEANETFGITTAKLKFVLTMMGNNQFTVYAVEEDDTEHLMQADINVGNLPSTFGVQIAQTGTWTVGMYTELEYQYYWNEVLELAHLGDVELKDLEDGQALIYDASTDKWVNGNGGVSATYNATTKTITFA